MNRLEYICPRWDAQNVSQDWGSVRKQHGHAFSLDHVLGGGSEEARAPEAHI